MKEIVADTGLIAKCGLYCGACKRYLKGGCPGCEENSKASWCKVRSCCIEHDYASCADCTDYADPKECGKYNTFVARMIGMVLRSDRRACIMKIKSDGHDSYVRHMADSRRMTLRH